MQIFTNSPEDFSQLDNPWRAVLDPKPTDKGANKGAEKSNINKFLRVLSDLLSYFESTQKGIELSNARIVEKYPKFLSKFALFSLQMDDSLFRETFLVQILIFAQSLADPVGMEQKNLIKLTSEELVYAKKVHHKAAVLIQAATGFAADKKPPALGKRKFGESLVKIVQQCEP